MRLFGKNGASGSICVCPEENSGVRIAVSNLAADIEKVCGVRPAVVQEMDESVKIVVGTFGVSPLVKNLSREELQTEEGKLRWEGCLQQEQDGRLYLAGCDRRGTIYAIYDFCERMGVSPWYDLADVPVKTAEEVSIEEGWHRADWPCVKYRGIFLNDEEELDMWAKLHTGDDTIGPETYRRIYELILRLKGNFIWPAMHVNAFNHNPENGRLAEEMGIVTGTSHCDMLHRSNQNEWKPWVESKGYEGLQYDYTIEGWNREKIKEYWRESLLQNRDFEVCYTIGMRGIHDSGFVTKGLEGRTQEELLAGQRELLEHIMADQRELIWEVLGKSDVPQAFVPYKEVLPIYDSGLQVPEDVTLIWADDNHGYVRRYPDKKEQLRKGGNGLYYHSSYWAPPGMSYLFICSAPLAQMGNELKKCYENGIREIWVDNVGALKPIEQDTEYFLRYGWDAGRPESIIHDTRRYTEEWIDRNFTGHWGRETADIYTEFAQLCNVCKPEHMRSGRFSQTAYGDEAAARVWRLHDLASRAGEIYEKLPEEEKGAYMQLMLMKIQAAFYVSASYYFADRSVASYERGIMRAADEYMKKSREMDDLKRMLLYYYNDKMCGGKWSGILTPEDFPPPAMEANPACRPALKLERGELVIRTVDYGEPGLLRFWENGVRTKWFELANTGIGSIPFEITADKGLELSEASGEVEVEKRIFVTPVRGCRGGQIQIQAAGRTWNIPVICEQEAAEADGYIHMPAAEYSRKSGGWSLIPCLGRGRGSVMEASATADGGNPWLEFDFNLQSEGSFELEIIRYLTLNSTGQIRMTLSVDGTWQETVCSETLDEWLGNWKEAALGDGEKLYVRLPGLQRGRHVLRLEAQDPYVTVFALNLYTGERLTTNLGPGLLEPDAPIPDFDIQRWSSMYGVAGEEVPLPRVVYAGRKFWTEDINYARNESIRPERRGNRRYVPAADGRKDIPAAFGRGVIQEECGQFTERNAGRNIEQSGNQAVEQNVGYIAWEAEYALEQSENAWCSADLEGIGWVHRQAETDGRTGLAMYIPQKGKSWKDREDAPAMHYRIRCGQGGVYQVWMLMKYDEESASHCRFALDGKRIPSECQVREGNFFSYRTIHMWCWQRMTEVELEKGEHIFSIVAETSELCIDRIYLTQGEENPPADDAWKACARKKFLL
ncbi:MAG: glycosyl hydrolase 115 family protein [Butyrivibrio sp.]|nr:glycosyl hydrolase 115 family protein [Acetatifactor muris]MCM1558475.1 glycosyl hydrolase 115 family protein [Butyrivibrio sp.]